MHRRSRPRDRPRHTARQLLPHLPAHDRRPGTRSHRVSGRADGRRARLLHTDSSPPPRDARSDHVPAAHPSGLGPDGGPVTRADARRAIDSSASTDGPALAGRSHHWSYVQLERRRLPFRLPAEQAPAQALESLPDGLGGSVGSSNRLSSVLREHLSTCVSQGQSRSKCPPQGSLRKSPISGLGRAGRRGLREQLVALSRGTARKPGTSP